MIKILYSLMICASAHATSKLFQIAGNSTNDLTIFGPIKDERMIRRWKFEFHRPQSTLPHTAPVNATLIFLAEKGRNLTIVNNQVYDTAAQYSDLALRISFAHGSDMARVNLNVMLLPYEDRHYMVTNVDSPYRFCDERSVGIINLDRGGFMPFSISLENVEVPSAYSLASRYRNTGTILSGDALSSVPVYIFEWIREAIQRRGCSDLALLSLPRIVFRTQSSVFFMEPSDYAEELGFGKCALKIKGSNTETTWGRNMLRKFGLMIDYRMPRYWICDPRFNFKELFARDSYHFEA